jgi:hypothetical protein
VGPSLVLPPVRGFSHRGDSKMRRMLVAIVVLVAVPVAVIVV